MESKRFLTAQDVMEMLGVSLSYSYKLIRRLNAELEADGFVTINYNWLCRKLCRKASRIV